ncbi:MAG: nucleoside-diphosphate kinase [Candidatus Krumholzibacteriia bacterium]|nr:nucleoside-diphosphate kinase [bacterium]MCB9514991.1 nucleoside-diphosphate kinase [Candidatus Latescibacterota bacterium]
MSETYLMIKPELVADQVIGEILAMLTANRFAIKALEMKRLSAAQVRAFYAEHEGKGFYDDLVAYISGGPVVAVRLEKDNAVADLRTLVGATNPENASPGTIRYLFGRSLQNNGVHASDSDASAARELGIIFGG